jgi:hypothetical protein
MCDGRSPYQPVAQVLRFNTLFKEVSVRITGTSLAVNRLDLSNFATRHRLQRREHVCAMRCRRRDLHVEMGFIGG